MTGSENRTAKETPVPKQIKVNLNTNSEKWELGEWPEDLLKCATLETEAVGSHRWSVEVNIDYEEAERVTRKIIKEAIEVFFEKEVFISIVRNGIQLCCLDGGQTVVAPFNIIDVAMKGSERDALVKMLNEMELDESNEYEFQYLDDTP
jgi:hypothetical protein